MHHRIYTPGPIAAGGEIEIRGDEFHHAVKVARLRMSEPVELFDGKGAGAAGKVTALERDSMRIHIDVELPSRESPLAVTVGMAIIQLEKFELVLQKATELGVRAFIPLVTDRVEIRAERYRGKVDRWEKIIFEAVKQSGRSVIPPIEEPAALGDVLGRAGTKVFFDADVQAAPAPPSVSEVTLLIGPEGGWSDREIAMARDAQCLIQRLGPRRLRAETAAIAGLAIIAARYGDI